MGLPEDIQLNFIVNQDIQKNIIHVQVKKDHSVYLDFIEDNLRDYLEQAIVQEAFSTKKEEAIDTITFEFKYPQNRKNQLKVAETLQYLADKYVGFIKSFDCSKKDKIEVVLNKLSQP